MFKKSKQFKINLLILFISLSFLIISNKGYSQTFDSLYTDGQIYVKIKDSSSVIFQNYSGNDSSLYSDLITAKSIFNLTSISKPFVNATFTKVYLFKFNNLSMIDSFIKTMKVKSYIEYAEKLPILKLFINTPNDPKFVSTSATPHNWHLKAIGADALWPLIPTTASNITSAVAVIDNEIQTTHPDLSANMLAGFDWADLDNNPSPDDPLPLQGTSLDHGTHVAGLVSAVSNNATGIASVGYNTLIVPYKIAFNGNTLLSLTAAINAITAATTNTNVAVITNSWGTTGVNITLQNAIAAAIAGGKVVVVAAGNSYNNIIPTYPADYPNVIKIAATNKNNTKFNFSNYGNPSGNNNVTVCAPGVGIYSTLNTNLTATENGYDFKDGTSMAAPQVAGLCALMRRVNPTITVAALKQCLMSTATNIDMVGTNSTLPVGSLGAGLVNAPAALLCAQGQSAAIYADKYNVCPGQPIVITGYSNYTNTPITYTYTVTSVPSMTLTTTVSGNKITVTAPANCIINVSLTVTAPSLPVATATLNNTIQVAGPTIAFVSAAAGAICDNSLQTGNLLINNVIPPYSLDFETPDNQVLNISNTQKTFLDLSYVARINNPQLRILNLTDGKGCSLPLQTISLPVINCCNNIVPNGDFEAGNIGYTSDNTYVCPLPANLNPEGSRSIVDCTFPTSPATACAASSSIVLVNTTWLPDYIKPYLKNVLEINGRQGAITLFNKGFNAVVSNTGNSQFIFIPNFNSRLYQSDLFTVVPNTTYNLDFYIRTNGGTPGFPQKTSFEIIDASNNIVFPSGGANVNDFILTEGTYKIQQRSRIWNSGSISGQIRVRILQKEFFDGSQFDMNIIEVSLRQASAVPTLSLTWSPTCPASNLPAPSLIITPNTNYSLTPTYIVDGVGPMQNIPLAASGFGTHTVSIANIPGCVVAKTFTVLQPPVVNLAISAIALSCNKLLTVTSGNTPAQAFISYTINSGIPQTSNIFTIVSSGIYTITVTNANGCTATSTIFISANPTITLNASSACLLSTTTITASASYTVSGATYTLNNGIAQTSNIFTNVNTGSIYTVVVSNGDGCSASSTVAINGTVFVSLTPNSPGPCFIEPIVTLTANATGFGTINYALNGGTSSTANTFTVTGTGTATYTITATAANGCTTTSAITLNFGPAIAIASSAGICITSGNTNLSATATTIYNPCTFIWQPGNVAGSIYNNAPAGITYSVTATDTKGCKATKTIAIGQVVPVNITAASGACIPNSGNNTLTASGGLSAAAYNWNPGNFTGNPYAITASGIYTVTATGTANCTGSSTIVISAAPNLCNTGTSISGTIGTATNFVNNANGYKIPASILINAAVTFNGANIGIGANVSITVGATGVLTINNSHLQTCTATDMWQGIIVQPGGRVIINNGSMLEDAKVAIDYLNNTTTATGAVADILNCNGAIFNRNEIAIRMAGNANLLATSYVVKNSLFTTRNIPTNCSTTMPNFAGLATLKATSIAASALNTPYLINNYTISTTKSGIIPIAHIQLTGIGKTTLVSGNNNTYVPITIGSTTIAEYNLFDGGKKAIEVNLCNLTCTNNVIQNCKNYPNPFPSTAFSTGFGIVANTIGASTTTLNKFRLIVNSATATNYNGANLFYDCGIGIYTYNMFDNNINYTKLFSTADVNNFSAIASFKKNTNIVGIKAIMTIMANSNTNIINYNQIYNYALGVHTQFKVINGISNVDIGGPTVNYNTISRVPTGTYAPNAFMQNAVVAEHIAALGSTLPVTTKSTLLSISNNTINEVYRGITLSNVIKRSFGANILTNNVTLNTDNIYKNTQYGIATSNCMKISEQRNTVTGTGALPTNSNVISYKHNVNFNSAIFCNTSRNAYVACEFNGVNTNTVFTNNFLNQGTHFYGLQLVNAANIGTQGSSTSASDNLFGAFATGGAHTNVDAATTNATNSKLFVYGSTVPRKPTTNAGTPQPSTYIFAGNLPAATAPANITACSTTTVVGTGTCCPGGSNVAIQLDAIAQNTIVYAQRQMAYTWMARYQLYQFLKLDSFAKASNTVLSTFYTTGVPANIKALGNIEDSLDAGKYTTAQTMLTAYAPANYIETNYKSFYTLYLKNILGTLTSTDSTAIFTMANMCADSNGAVVYQARSLYNAIYPLGYTIFDNTCGAAIAATGSFKKPKQTTTSTNTINLEIDLYPNPNSGTFTIACNKQTTDKLTLYIYDVSGKLVDTKYCTTQGLVCDIQTSLNTGIYFIKIVEDNNHEVCTKKISIIN